MNAIAARWEFEQARLWTGSALTALLMHLVPVALLVLYLHWSPKPPRLAGSQAALDVELASPPPAAAPAASSPKPQPAPQPQTRQPRLPPLVTVKSVQPLSQMQPIPQPDAVPSRTAPVAPAAATSAPVEPSDLDARGAPDLGLQVWEDEIVARLAGYKEYPSSALKQMQQDTVSLHISVDHAGQVTYSRVDSTHHYQALEQEVQQMLRLAGRLPAPPSQLSSHAVVTVPVQFALDFMPNILCSGSHCPSARGAQSKPKAVAPPPPTLASCTAAASPGPAPAAATATLEQMRAYRERLNQYLAAAGNQLACLSQVREANTLASRDSLTGQLKSMVDDFNTQAHAFEAKAQARALQAQQARQRQAQALAAQTYATCKLPSTPPAPGSALTADAAPSYRRQLAGYQSAVRSYVDCLRQANLAAAAPERGLASDQRAQLAQTAVQLGNAAIQSFNQVVTGFNAQVPHLRQQALAAEVQQNLAEAVVRGTAIFPSSTWSVPAPLPADECFRILRIGQTYRAQLCNPAYVTTASGLAQLLKSTPQVSDSSAVRAQKIRTNEAADAIASEPGMEKATQQEGIAALHGVFPGQCKQACGQPPILGIAIAPKVGVQIQTENGASRLQTTTSYSVSELQVAGRHLSMTISGKSDNAAGGVDSSTVHFDLVLSPDNRTLSGYCWTGQERQACTLAQSASSTAVASAPLLTKGCVAVDRYQSPRLFDSPHSDLLSLQQSESTQGQWRFTNQCGMGINITIVAPSDPHTRGGKGKDTVPIILASGQAFIAPDSIQTYKYFVCPIPLVAFDSTSSPGHAVSVSYASTKTMCLIAPARGPAHQ